VSASGPVIDPTVRSLVPAASFADPAKPAAASRRWWSWIPAALGRRGAGRWHAGALR